MKTIWKFPLAARSIQAVKLPMGAEILSAQWQESAGVCLWALCNPNTTIKEEHTIRMFGTGEPISEEEIHHRGYVYLSTVQVPRESLVFHVFRSREIGP